MNILYLCLFVFSTEAILLDEAVYNIIYNNSYLNYDLRNLKLSDTLREEIDSNFRIRKIIPEKIYSNNSNNSYYYIEHILSNESLIATQSGKLNLTKNLSTKNPYTNLYIEKNLAEWNFIQTKENKYIIQNRKKCFLKIKQFNVACENITVNEASEFRLIKIYEEVRHSKEDIELIEKEPIDVVIKYIDFTDEKMKFFGLPKKRPQFDDQELKYCIRSILKNIPWIRKIYILMPNNEVKYFKDYEHIKDKIIYLKDTDIFDKDNYNWLVFKFRYWKLKKFGISDNFIAMDYNNFVGTPLNKSDFFYVVNGNVTPAIITNKFIELRNMTAPNLINSQLRQNIFKLCTRLSTSLFKNSLYNTYLYIFKLFNATGANFVPAHNFNSIPLNIKELEEIYYTINNCEYRFNTLYALTKEENSIQFQAFALSYSFIKYKKKVSNIPIKLINNKKPILNDYNISLFSFFTEEDTCEQIYYQKAKIILEYLFGKESPYERPIINNTFHILAFNTVYEIDREFREYKSAKNNYTKQLNDELKSIEVKIECVHFGMAFIIICYLVYKKIKLKNRHKLKGYMAFSQNENE